MPLNAVGWPTEDDEKLIELVKPHSFLYNVLDPSRKNILARESTWQDIAQVLSKPVEECKKRWRGIRDGYVRSKRMGTVPNKAKITMFEKLQFLDETMDGTEDILEESVENVHEQIVQDETNVIGTEEQVITDNQVYYEMALLDGPKEPQVKQLIKITKMMPIPRLGPPGAHVEPPKKVIKRSGGRKKSTPMPRNIPPIKILPKPINLINGPKILTCIEDPKTPDQRSLAIDKLVEKMLKENTNEVDVFFRSMAASVKKLQPNLIPKVKMEVCNVIAKYEIQSYEKNPQGF